MDYFLPLGSKIGSIPRGCWGYVVLHAYGWITPHFHINITRTALSFTQGISWQLTEYSGLGMSKYMARTYQDFLAER